MLRPVWIQVTFHPAVIPDEGEISIYICPCKRWSHTGEEEGGREGKI
jgi:hypothetical protein